MDHLKKSKFLSTGFYSLVFLLYIGLLAVAILTILNSGQNLEYSLLQWMHIKEGATLL